MRKIFYLSICLVLLFSCSRHTVPTGPYSSNALADTLKLRKANIKNNTHIEFFDQNGKAVIIPQSAFRIQPLTSPSPVTLPLLQWNDTAQVWTKGINARYTNRLNITILCDGYLATDSLKALQDSKNIISALKIRAPFSWYYNRLSFYIVFAHSIQQGIGQITATCGPAVTVNNYFGTYLGISGICRMATCNNTTVNNVLAGTMPYTDIPVVLCNTAIYGGAADGSMAIVTANTTATEVFIHEMGHALFGLGDEYAYGGCGYPACYNAIATYDTAQARKLWGDTWVTWLTGCGLFAGADYCPAGVRDSADCEMRDLSQPFCPQCKKRGIYSINYYTSSIDAFAPALTATTTNGFSVKILQPVFNTIKIVWWVNGVVKQVGGNTFTPGAGTYTTVKVEAYDTSKWLFKTLAPHYSQTWNNITVTGSPVPPPTCSTPTALTTTGITTTTATLSWKATGALKYRILLSGRQYITTATAGTVPGLMPGTSYTWQVKGICSKDSSSYSAPVMFTTQPTNNACNVTAKLFTGQISGTTAYIQCSLVPGAVTYNFLLDGVMPQNVQPSTLTTTVTAIYRNLSHGRHSVQVETICKSGNSAYSAALPFNIP